MHSHNGNICQTFPHSTWSVSVFTSTLHILCKISPCHSAPQQPTKSLSKSISSWILKKYVFKTLKLQMENKFSPANMQFLPINLNMKNNFALFIFCYQRSLSASSLASIKQIDRGVHFQQTSLKLNETQQNSTKLSETQCWNLTQIN